MKFLAIAAIAAVAAALPQEGGTVPAKAGGGGAPAKGSSGGGPRASTRTGATSNELTTGQCKPIILIFARASTEPGNMGGTMGPAVCSGLKKQYPDKVACQGVGGAYSAGLVENVSASGTTAGAIAEATKMFTTANTKCPDSLIVFGGYSQGTAVMMNAVKGLPENIKKKTVGGVLFGYTKNGQTKGTIPGYPKDQLTVFCDETSPGKFGDGVCGGSLLVNGGHFVYMMNGDGTKAVNFLKTKIDSALGGKSVE